MRIITSVISALTALTLFSAGVAAQQSSHTQPATQQQMEDCAALATDGARLRCFQALTEQGRQPAEAQETRAVQAEVKEAVPETVPETVRETENPEPPVPVIESRAEDVEDVEEVEIVADEPAPPVDRSPSGLGREQLRENRFEPEPEEVSVILTVNEVREGPRGILFFHMDNGQVWRQLESGFFPYPRPGAFPVEINQGMMGEYRLRVEGRGRMLRIRRVE